MLLKNFFCPFNLVFYSRSGGMCTIPEFKIIDSIVTANTVLVMNRLVFGQLAPQVLFHDEPMFRSTSAVYNNINIAPRGRDACSLRI